MILEGLVTPDIASLDPPVVTDMRVQEDLKQARMVIARKSRIDGISWETKNRRIVLNRDLLVTPKTFDYSYIVL